MNMKPLKISEKESCLKLLKKNGGLYYSTFSVEMRSDKEIALLAVTLAPKALLHVMGDLVDDEDVVRRCLNTPSQELYDSYGVSMEAPEISIYTTYKGRKQDSEYAFRMISSRLRNQKKFVKEFIFTHPGIYKYCQDKIKDSESITFYAIKSGYTLALSHCSERIKTNKDFILKAISIDAQCLSVLGNHYWTADLEVVLATVKKNPRIAWASMDDSLKYHKDIILETFKKDAIVFDLRMTKRPELFNEFIIDVANQKEDWFIQALKNIDICEENGSVEIFPEPQNEKTIAFILSKISKESLGNLEIKNAFLWKRITKEIQRKAIFDVSNQPAKAVNKKQRKVLF